MALSDDTKLGLKKVISAIARCSTQTNLQTILLLEPQEAMVAWPVIAKAPAHTGCCGTGLVTVMPGHEIIKLSHR